MAIAKEAGFDESKADWLRDQAQKTLELSDVELEGVSGAGAPSCHGRDTECETLVPAESAILKVLAQFNSLHQKRINLV